MNFFPKLFGLIVFLRVAEGQNLLHEILSWDHGGWAQEKEMIGRGTKGSQGEKIQGEGREMVTGKKQRSLTAMKLWGFLEM